MPLHRIALLLALAGSCLLCEARVFAGTTLQVVDGGVDYVHYDPPNEQQVKYKLSYSSADPIGGDALLKTVKIEQYAVTGGNPQMVAETPQCIYDNKHSQVRSSSALQVHALNGRLFVEGVGFLLQINTSSLIISNQVHSVFEFQTATNAPAPAITEIFSHRAEYLPKSDASNGLAIYEGSVRLLNPSLNLTSDYLAADLPKDESGQTNRVNHVIATTNVVLNFINTNGDEIHALGHQAVYDRVIEPAAAVTVTNETLELTGNPRINLTNGWMTADDFIINRATGKLLGTGNFHFHYPAPTQSANGIAGRPDSSTPTETQISSGQFEFDFDTRLAQFWNHVRVDDPRMRLTSENLFAKLPQNRSGQTNYIDHVVAETNVTINFADDKSGQKVHAAGQKATYDYQAADGITNQVLELTGNPSVETSGADRAGWMTANVITVDRAQGRIWGKGNHHSVLKKRPGEPATMDTEIFSDDFEFAISTGLSVYQGNVRAYDPSMNLTSRKLTLTLGKTPNGRTNHLERVDAVGDVVIDFIEKPFAPDDLTNLTAFAARLKQPAADDAPAQYVVSHISAPTRQLLIDYKTSSSAPALGEKERIGGQVTHSQLSQALALDLNRLTQTGSIYQSGQFTKVFLSQETLNMLRQQPMGTDLIQLNRLLLLDAFRGQLGRGNAGEKILATGNHAVYTSTITANSTNEVLELSGHPKLEKPAQWTTAEKAIIYDRITGVAHFVGQPHFHTRLEGLAKAPTAGKMTTN